MMPLESLLILHRFICKQFGFDDLPTMSAKMADVTNTGDNSDFAKVLDAHLLHKPVTKDALARYDNNIGEISRQLKMNTPGRTWKPFQYLALLFAERYLHLYFEDADALREQLNAFNKDHYCGYHQQQQRWADISDYQESDLRTLAFQSATGSGKTLLLQANILQYHRYAREYRQAHRLNKIILLTPNEQMSRQHEQELTASGIPARLFDGTNSGLFTGDIIVDIIDIHKLSDRAGIKTVAVEAFEENNLVMVDEGHLGTTGKKWRDLRRRLVKNGFCFEYSATFNQAVAGSDRKDLREAYGKCLLFDYSYRYFYGDGYGKDYKISNLRQGGDTYVNNLYLTACLLTFYQQRRLYEEKNAQWREYNLATPLWVFLGKTVAAATAIITDVERIVRFFAWVLTERTEVTKDFRKLLSGTTDLLNAEKQDLFAEAFPTLKNTDPDVLYDDICRLIFRGKGQLHIAHLTAGDELHLSAGQNKPFGVINVGNAAGLYKLLKEKEDRPFMLSKDNFSPSLFDSIDSDDSPINIAIGAQRFVAGWNSWRVSTMGLMNVGRGEGPQIIQMFGRGVRLKGMGMSLKRHTALNHPTPSDSNLIKLLETLNIFGLRANYMEQFQKYVGMELPITRTITMPVIKNFGNVRGLKVLRLKPGADYAFSDDELELPADKNAVKGVIVDRYPQLQALASDEAHGSTQKNTEEFSDAHCRLMNCQRIYFRLLKYKEEKGWHNLYMPVSAVRTLITLPGWYTLYIPAEKLMMDDFGKVAEWEDIMAELIAEYANRFWQQNRGHWENDRMELVDLTDEDENYPRDGYQITIDTKGAKEKELIKDVERLKADIENQEIKEETDYPLLKPLMVKRHAYIPLLWKPDNSRTVTIRPVALNDGEKRAVDCVDVAARYSAFDGIKIYLMRNFSRGRGVSLFVDYRFYPDFILWMKQGEQQHIVFIDPKGLVHFGHRAERKAELHKDIKTLQTKLQKKHPTVFLHSYIWTETNPKDIGSDKPMTHEECREKGIYLAEKKAPEMIEMLTHALTNTAPTPKD